MEIRNLSEDKRYIREALTFYWDIETHARGSSRNSAEFMVILTDLNRAMKALETPHRTMVFMNTALGFSTEEIGEKMDIPRSTVIHIVNKSLGKMQRHLEGVHNGRRITK